MTDSSPATAGGSRLEPVRGSDAGLTVGARTVASTAGVVGGAISFVVAGVDATVDAGAVVVSGTVVDGGAVTRVEVGAVVATVVGTAVVVVGAGQAGISPAVHEGAAAAGEARTTRLNAAAVINV